MELSIVVTRLARRKQCLSYPKLAIVLRRAQRLVARGFLPL
jgi:hypothetical protein